jgi:enoyl-CoA hydratase/carnithine racemase
VPTSAAVDGPAFSEGACLALACDIRLAATTGSIGFGFRRFGQAAAAGASFLLPRIVGRDVAAELLYTGELLDAQAAVDRGLFTRVVTAERFEDELADLVATISTGPAAAMQANKQLLNEAYDSLGAAIDAEQRLQKRLAETADFREGVTAFLEQRRPDF